MKNNESEEKVPDILSELKDKLQGAVERGAAILAEPTKYPDSRGPEEVMATMRCAKMMLGFVNALIEDSKPFTQADQAKDPFVNAFMWATLAPIMIFMYDPQEARNLWVSIYRTFIGFQKQVLDQDGEELGESEIKH